MRTRAARKTRSATRRCSKAMSMARSPPLTLRAHSCRRSRTRKTRLARRPCRRPLQGSGGGVPESAGTLTRVLDAHEGIAYVEVLHRRLGRRPRGAGQGQGRRDQARRQALGGRRDGCCRRAQRRHGRVAARPRCVGEDRRCPAVRRRVHSASPRVLVLIDAGRAREALTPITRTLTPADSGQSRPASPARFAARRYARESRQKRSSAMPRRDQTAAALDQEASSRADDPGRRQPCITAAAAGDCQGRFCRRPRAFRPVLDNRSSLQMAGRRGGRESAGCGGRESRA